MKRKELIRRLTEAGCLIVLCLLPLSAYCLSDRGAFELLAQKSKRIEKFPFHVYVMPDYTDFEGVSLPVSSYGFFAATYEDLKNTRQPGEIFAIYQFSQGSRWRLFLLRVPGMYAINAIDLWAYDTQENKWQKPLRIAQSWGDAGYFFYL
jgi:hypothetical protein